jgi:hypothetical protein
MADKPCASSQSRLIVALSEHLADHIERRREAHLQAGVYREGGMFAGRFVLGLEELRKLVERRATGRGSTSSRGGVQRLGLFLVCVTQQRSDLAGPWGEGAAGQHDDVAVPAPVPGRAGLPARGRYMAALDEVDMPDDPAFREAVREHVGSARAWRCRTPTPPPTTICTRSARYRAGRAQATTGPPERCRRSVAIRDARRSSTPSAAGPKIRTRSSGSTSTSSTRAHRPPPDSSRPASIAEPTARASSTTCNGRRPSTSPRCSAHRPSRRSPAGSPASSSRAHECAIAHVTARPRGA